MRSKSEDKEKRKRSHERKQHLEKDAKTVGGLEKGQRRMMADERRIKDQDDRIRSGDASSNRISENGHIPYLSVMRSN